MRPVGNTRLVCVPDLCISTVELGYSRAPLVLLRTHLQLTASRERLINNSIGYPKATMKCERTAQRTSQACIECRQ